MGLPGGWGDRPLAEGVWESRHQPNLPFSSDHVTVKIQQVNKNCQKGNLILSLQILEGFCSFTGLTGVVDCWLKELMASDVGAVLVITVLNRVWLRFGMNWSFLDGVHMSLP